ncbi:hypothetical protein HS1genome_2398 [Sulfodiicoccus acidiphilus]|uniref:Uncharacterized protein n=1 Tax=Sulfodiicoccus acidiphilus TaxID=1670455 RepID=A0A348B757_9CREN|nr:hypothetical protein [Sulfodiicoccus acidiphilus]BBD74009.1 hypothetical protein HS1genome_2398 [Sulfodiicoccus acidiphilus]GGT87192.1 hypothetical protein GCM10007116_01560 [Sulfodiicoccus acidiphilus]
MLTIHPELKEDLLLTYIGELKRRIYAYNEDIRGKGVYLKPVHFVYKRDGRKYVYVGRYWYVLRRRDGKLKWNYVGSEKPLSSLPDPPYIPRISLLCVGENCEVL